MKKRTALIVAAALARQLWQGCGGETGRRRLGGSGSGKYCRGRRYGRGERDCGSHGGHYR